MRKRVEFWVVGTPAMRFGPYDSYDEAQDAAWLLIARWQLQSAMIERRLVLT